MIASQKAETPNGLMHVLIPNQGFRTRGADPRISGHTDDRSVRLKWIRRVSTGNSVPHRVGQVWRDQPHVVLRVTVAKLAHYAGRKGSCPRAHNIVSARRIGTGETVLVPAHIVIEGVRHLDFSPIHGIPEEETILRRQLMVDPGICTMHAAAFYGSGREVVRQGGRLRQRIKIRHR